MNKKLLPASTSLPNHLFTNQKISPCNSLMNRTNDAATAAVLTATKQTSPLTVLNFSLENRKINYTVP